jgi:hypothetical protein
MLLMRILSVGLIRPWDGCWCSCATLGNAPAPAERWGTSTLFNRLAAGSQCPTWVGLLWVPPTRTGDCGKTVCRACCMARGCMRAAGMPGGVGMQHGARGVCRGAGMTYVSVWGACVPSRGGWCCF